MTQTPRIKALSQLVADQIAAGEVIERPASVVKELVDNAIDAGAKNITLRIEGMGVELLEVQDDGHGMTREDAALATQRHATSKLRELSDLNDIGTMGFRGEALASIAAVAKLELTTRTAESIEATCVRAGGGKELSIEPAGAPVGTRVRVRDLFFNVPARRKFLKAKATENNLIAGVVRRAALAHSDLRLRLLRDGRETLAFLPAPNAGEHLQQCFPKDTFTKVAQTHKSVRMLAWLGSAKLARSGSGQLYLFVNQRPVVDRKLVKAVAAGFGDALPPGKAPCGAVFLTVPTRLVDVNVHPQKAEVRFADELGLYAAVSAMVASHHYRERLGASEPSGAGPDDTLGRGAGFWDERLGGLVGKSRPSRSAAKRPETYGALAPGDSFGTATVSDAVRPPRREQPPKAQPAATPKPKAPAPTTKAPAPAPKPPAPQERLAPALERAVLAERERIVRWLRARADAADRAGEVAQGAALRLAADDLSTEE